MSKIGIFDSGIGGLTVLRGIKDRLPQYDYLYLGDNARAPYGSKTQEEIYEFTKQAVDFLFKNNCELIVLACNTASSEALRKIQQDFLPNHHPKKRVLGVLIPACEKAVEDGNKKIGIMATESTVESGAYIRELKKLDNKVEVSQVACPDLVNLIEAGEISSRILDESLDRYVAKILDSEAVILGCTHYELIESNIKKKLKNIEVISQSTLVAEKLKEYLLRHKEFEINLTKNGTVRYFTTGDFNKFQKITKKIFHDDIKVDSINLN